MKHSLVRQTIIDTASNLFYQNGYNLTGINEIIREAGIAKATLYSHFRSKDDICIAYLKNRNEPFLRQIKAFAEKQKTGKSQVLGVFDFLSLFFKDKSFNGCWCINTFSEIPRENAKIRTEIQNQKKDFLNLVEDLVITNYQNLSQKEQKIVAKQVYLLYESAISESHIHQEAWPINAAREMADAILR